MSLIAILSTAIATTTPWSSSEITAQLHRRQSTWTRQKPSPSVPPSQLILQLRGGDSDDGVHLESSKRKGKAGKKSSRSKVRVGADEDDAVEVDDAKHAISEAMKATDAATALGNAIRDRADILLQDKLPFAEQTFDAALVSLGFSLGTAGTDSPEKTEESKTVDTMAYYQYGQRNSIYPHNSRLSNQQSVPPATSAVVANYFLKTHGGTHAIQCLLSLLASVLGMACLLLPSFPNAEMATAKSTGGIDAQQLSRGIYLACTKYQLLQQTLLLAVAKHASGLIGAVLLGAAQIPELGIRNTRRHLERVAFDPIGQYLFYCSLLVVWMNWFGGGGSGMIQYIAGLKGAVVSIMNASSASSGTTNGSSEQGTAAAELLNALSQNPPPWYLSQSRVGCIIPIMMLIPILLREIISIIWVMSDVLTLVFTSSGGLAGKFMHGVLSSSRSVLDAFMSILITADKWRKADSFQRQRTLAKLVSQCSLGAELVMGAVLIGDAVRSFWKFAFVGSDVAVGGKGGVASGGRLPFKAVLGKIMCAHLYLNFLLSRREKIQVLIGSIRGGAVLDRVLDVLLDPTKEMGLIKEDDDED